MITELIVAALLVAGGVFGFVGSYGLVKLPDLMTRLHAPTKATTLGVGGMVLASMAHFAFTDKASLHELLIALFLFLTAPISANMVAKAWLHRNSSPEKLPPTGREKGWANFDAPPEQ